MKERKVIEGRFDEKVAIVSGGSAGIGKAIVEELCKEGASVAFSGIEGDLGARVLNEMQGNGYDVLFCHGDMASEEFCAELVDQTVTKWGKIDFLVNNAFSFIAKGIDAEREDWERSLMVGPVAFATMAQLAVPYMKKQNGGAIVNISSISAFIAQPNRWTYNAAKGAVRNLTKCMALDLAPHNIRVNTVSPGWIWTREVEKAANMDGGGRAKWEPVWGEYHMMERCGEPVEVAGPVLFLLSDDASFVTAADLMVDGGYIGMGSEGLGKTTVLAGSK